MKKLVCSLIILALILPVVLGGTAYAQDTPVWEKTYYTDMFGDPTDEWYITNTELFTGTFKNSATDGSPLSAKILVDLDSVSIVLYEYEKDRVKNAFANDVIYNIAIKTVSGEKVAVVGTLKSGGDRIVIDNSAYVSDFIVALYGKGVISIYIEQAVQNLNNYLFKAECGNFTEVFSEELYQLAIQYRDNEEYGTAIEIFTYLSEYGDYKDSREQINVTYYTEADGYKNKGQYRDALIAFESLGGYMDSKEKAYSLKETAYNEAERLLKEGQIEKAAPLYYISGDYKSDSREKSFSLWRQVLGHKTIAAGQYHTVALKSDGTVYAAGSNDNGQCNVSEWSNIIEVAAGDKHTLGLRSDGIVLVTQKDGYIEVPPKPGSTIVSITAYGGRDLVLTSEGTVLNRRPSKDPTYGTTYGWTDVVQVAIGLNYYVGLRADGTVIASGINDDGQCDVSEWRDIISIAVGGVHTLGLKADGTVLSTGDNNYGSCRTTGWNNVIDIATELCHSIGIKADGTAVAAGYNTLEDPVRYSDDKRCDVSGWRDIVEVALGEYHSVGLKADGTLAAAGSNLNGQCNVSGWTNIKLPNT